MKKLILTTILGLLILSADALAQEGGRNFFQALAGKWRGTLEYQDYSADRRVTLNTVMTFKPAADGNSAEVFIVYDDFGKIYRANGRQRIDAAAKKFFDDETEFTVESIADGRLVLLGKTQDGDRVEPTRKTITVSGDRLTILKETRAPWQFRHLYTLRRLVENREPEKVLSAAALAEDFAVFKKTLTELHPGIYRYHTPEGLAGDFAELEGKLTRSMRESEFLILVAQFTARLNCGHTYANFYNQDEKLRARLFEGRTYLPFYFRIVDGKMIVTANASSKKLAAGSELTRINGVAVGEIIEKLLMVAKADGRGAPGHRVQALELTRHEAEKYALFDWYFPLFFPLSEEIFTIDALDFASKKAVKFQIPAMTKAERTLEMAARYGPPPTYDDGWKFEIRNGSTGYLKIDNSIVWRLKTINFKEFLAAAFAELRAKNVKKLIIDLRGNDGGSMDIGFELARYLAPKPLPPYAESRRLVRNVAARPELLKYLDTYSQELKNGLKDGLPESSFRRFDDRYFEITNRENYPAVEPYENNFRGRAFIVADASNASATFQFLNYVQTNRLATLVGQSTGGNKQGINGGNYFFLSLPNSRVEIDIPVYFSAPLEPQKDESVIPDVPVKRRPEDIGNGFDRELAVIKDLIRKD
jgi:hypothetical protein